MWYQVTLSVGEEVISSEVIYTTNYTYCPIDLTNGEYRLNITTINGAGTGIASNITIMFTTGMLILLHFVYNFNLMKLFCHLVNKIVVFFQKSNVIRNQQYWTFHFILSVSNIVPSITRQRIICYFNRSINYVLFH